MTGRMTKRKRPFRIDPRVVVNAAKAGYKAYQWWNGPPAKKAKTYIDSTTTQADKSVIPIRSSKKARARVRRHRKFAMRVAKANDTLQFSRTFMKSATVTAAVLGTDLTAVYNGTTTWGKFGRQKVIHIPLLQYSDKTNPNSVNDDLNDLLECQQASATADVNQTNIGSIYIRSFMMELMLRNRSTNAMYADVYYYRTVKTNPISPEDVITSATAITSSDNAIGQDAPVSNEVYGWTPYHAWGISKNIRIFKKERYFLPSGAISQLEWRGKVNKIYKKDQRTADGTGVENKIIKGISQGMFIIVYGVQQNTNADDVITGSFDMSISVQKSIRWNAVQTPYVAGLPTTTRLVVEPSNS